MEQKRAYRYRFYPTPQQAAVLVRTFGCARYVYNWALRLRTDAYYERQERISYHGTSAALTALKHKHLRRGERRLAHAQRNLARKQLGSKNRDKARQKVARLHAKIADQRSDGLHKLTTRLIRENQVICAESLAVKNLVRNHALAKAISDVGWGELVRQLEYKAAWYGRTLVRIDRWYPSSQRCHACGYIYEALTLDIREWTCPNSTCGIRHDRDINAAKNILAVGRTVNACGETVRPGRAMPAPARPDEAGIPRL